jgi:hypothetical protein
LRFVLCVDDIERFHNAVKVGKPLA